MPSQPKTISDAVQLLQTAELITKAAHTIVSEWSKDAETQQNLPLTNGRSANNPPLALPSHELYEAQRIVLAATGKLTELVSDPSVRILEVATQFQESRSLYIAAERRIPDFLAADGSNQGKHISEISKDAKIESRKLCGCIKYVWICAIAELHCSSHIALSELDRNLQAG
jgi:hypothetical protein